MYLIQIDPVRLQPPQAALHLRQDVAARRAFHLSRIIHRLPNLCGQDNVFASRAQYPAQDRLGTAAVSIDIGGIEQSDPEIDRLVYYFARVLKVNQHAKIIAAQSHFRDRKIRFA